MNMTFVITGLNPLTALAGSVLAQVLNFMLMTAREEAEKARALSLHALSLDGSSPARCPPS